MKTIIIPPTHRRLRIHQPLGGAGGQAADIEIQALWFDVENPMEALWFWWFYDGNPTWLCQNSYWKLPVIVDVPIENGDFP